MPYWKIYYNYIQIPKPPSVNYATLIYRFSSFFSYYGAIQARAGFKLAYTRLALVWDLHCRFALTRSDDCFLNHLFFYYLFNGDLQTASKYDNLSHRKTYTAVWMSD